MKRFNEGSQKNGTVFFRLKYNISAGDLKKRCLRTSVCTMSWWSAASRAREASSVLGVVQSSDTFSLNEKALGGSSEDLVRLFHLHALSRSSPPVASHEEQHASRRGVELGGRRPRSTNSAPTNSRMIGSVRKSQRDCLVT